jgi:hypothetical protein
MTELSATTRPDLILRSAHSARLEGWLQLPGYFRVFATSSDVTAGAALPQALRI